jgi:trk system potassium uptake protein
MRIIMVGGDKTVYFLTRQFVNKGYHVTVINREIERCRELAEQTKAAIVHGDGSNVSRLEEAGARRADVVMALTSHDQDNLITCQIAQKIYGVPRTMALVNDPENETVFEQLGITVVFSATKVIASVIEQQADFEDITSLIPLANGRVNVTDVRLDSDSPAIGKSLEEIDLTHGSLVACILRDDEVLVPRGSTRLLVNDHLILISQPENQSQDLVVLCGVNE